MSGLLSKATAAEETSPSKPVEEETKADTSALAQAIEQSDGPDIPTILTSVGWAVIVIGGLLSLQGGAWGLIFVLGVLVIGIGALYAGQHMSESGVDPMRMGGAAVLAVLLAAGPYGVSMFMPESGSFGISDLELKEESDEISFRVIGSANSVDAVITADGVEKWSSSKELSQESARFTVPISEIFVGNAWQCNSGSCPTTPAIEYMISVTSGETTQTIDINPEFMTREVLDSGVKISTVTVTENECVSTPQGEECETVTEIDGIVVEMMAGLLPTSHEHLDGGGHTDANGIWIEGDYSLEMVILRGNTVVYGQSSSQGCPSATEGFPYIEVSGTTATSCRGDAGVSVNGWFAMPGPATDTVGTEYLDLESFYDEDDCYTFQVTITNTISNGDELVVVQDDVAWDLDFDSNKEGPWDMNTC